MGNGDQLEDALLDTAAPEMRNAIFRHHIVHIVPWNRHHRTGLQLRRNLGNSLFRGGLECQNALAALGMQRAVGKAECAAGTGELLGADGLGAHLTGDIHFNNGVNGHHIVIFADFPGVYRHGGGAQTYRRVRGQGFIQGQISACKAANVKALVIVLPRTGNDALASFDGIVIAVSHDRYFLDKIATQIFEVSDSGEVLRYTGGYTDYLGKRRESAPEVKEKKEKKEMPREPKPQKLRFSYKEQREYAVIEDEIAQLEEKIAQADADMAANATDYTALQRLTEEKEQLETALEEKMGRWMYLSELAEKIEAQKES